MAKTKKKAPARPAARLKKKKAAAKPPARSAKRKGAAKRGSPSPKRSASKKVTPKRTSSKGAVAAPARDGISAGAIRRPAAIEIKLAIAKPASLRIDCPERRQIAMPVPMTLAAPIAPIAMRAPVVERSLPPHDREE